MPDDLLPEREAGAISQVEKLLLSVSAVARCDARIRRVVEGHGVGVEFMRMSESSFNRLQEYLLE